MRLKLLAISDTHLGEDTSLLSFPRGRQHLWKILRKFFGEGQNNDRFEIEEAILLGDTTDRTLSSTSQIVANTNAFIQMLGGVADIKRGVFVPGNHEHTLWTDYHQRRDGNGKYYSVTKPSGELIVKKGERCDKNKSAEELLTIFFGYPSGSSWRTINDEKKFEFAIANPVYVKQINGQTYVFTHGTHFRRDVSAPKIIKKIADYIELDELLGDIEIDSDCDISKAKNLEGLEKEAARFVDSLWPSSKNNPTSQSDQLWYLLTVLGGKLKDKEHRRPSYSSSQLYIWSDLKKVDKKRIRRLTTTSGKAKEKSIELWEKYFRGHMIEYLKRKNMLKVNKDNIVFVYGDTHNGGWGEQKLNSGGKIRIYNTGGWVVHNPQDHPACHIFVVDDSCHEYLLDVSYKGVKEGEETLLKIAARDNENHNRNTSRLLRFFTRILLRD
jgi:hypothetical protein